jgi:hypothetical protein
MNMAQEENSFHEKLVTVVAGLALVGMVAKILFF